MKRVTHLYRFLHEMLFLIHFHDLEHEKLGITLITFQNAKFIVINHGKPNIGLVDL